MKLGKQKAARNLNLVRAQTTGKAASGKRRRRNRGKGDGNMPMYRHISGRNDVRRWLSLNSVVSSTVGGNIAFFTIDASQVQTVPFNDWNNISGEFQEYRVEQIVYQAAPSVISSLVGTYLAGGIFVSRWWDAAPTNFTGMGSEPSLEYFSTAEEFEFETNFVGYNEGQLWTPTGQAIPVAQRYGLAFIGHTSNTLPASTQIYTTWLRYLVHFRGTL